MYIPPLYKLLESAEISAVRYTNLNGTVLKHQKYTIFQVSVLQYSCLLLSLNVLSTIYKLYFCGD